MVSIYNQDSLHSMYAMPDNYYDVAIVDPPYGINISKNPVRQAHAKKEWDSNIPSEEYFTQLKRVSKEQIIWGGNYFLDYLGASKNFVVWNKLQPENFSLAMGEFAWSSFNKVAKIFTKRVVGGEKKTHPTQKPVELYEFIIRHYVNEGDKVLDTHLGSGTIGVAIRNANKAGMNITFDGYEIDKEYFDNAHRRIFPEQYEVKEGLFSDG